MKISQLLENDKTISNPFSEPLWHGSETLRPGTYSFKFRKKPRDTFGPIHNTISKLSNERFGINIRSLMFGSFDYWSANEYGTTLQLTPLGDRHRLFVSDGTEDVTATYRFDVENTCVMLHDLIKQSVSFDIPVPTYKHFTTIIREYHANFDGSFDVFIKEFEAKVFEALDELGEEYDKSRIGRQFKSFTRHTYNDINEYLGTVHEIKDSTELRDKRSEVMIYAPDGLRLSDNVGDE